MLRALPQLSGPELVTGWCPLPSSSRPWGHQQQCSACELDLPLVSACLFKYSGRGVLSQKEGKPVWGSPPEGAALSLCTSAGNVSEEALIPYSA